MILSNKILAGGEETVTVPAGEAVSIYSDTACKVYQRVGYPNHPESDSLLGEVNGVQVKYGAYASGATIIIKAGVSDVEYEVGTVPEVKSLLASKIQPNPSALNATGTLSHTILMNQICTSTSAAAVTATLVAGATLDLATEFKVDESFDWSVVNTGPNTVTVTANTGHTVVGAGAVATATSGLFRTRKTAADTFITYRLA